MNFYKITFSGNYCGYDDEYVYTSEKTYEEVDRLVCEEADDRTCSEAFDVDEDEEEFAIYGEVDEIDEEEYNRLKKDDYLEDICL